jgi:diguanylate cyclase (GGDEF)-like protein/PAS domain S-box-containing protein
MLDERAITESVLRRSYAFERFGAPAAVLDGSGAVVETNEAWRVFALLNEARTIATGPGANYLRVCDRAYNSGVKAAGTVAAGLRSILRGERRSFELEYPCHSPIEDRWFCLHASSAPVHDGAGIVLFHVNITARKLLEERLGRETGRDPVTGLLELGAARHLVERSLARATAEHRVSVISLKIDDLTSINHELGAPAARDLLVQATARLLRARRDQDRLCQLGNDELVLVCTDLDDNAVAGIVRRLRDSVESPYQVGAFEVSVRVHVGWASSDTASTAEALLATATANGSAQIPAERRSGHPRSAIARRPPETPPNRHPAPLRPTDPARAQRDAVVARSNEIVIYMEPDRTIAWASPATQAVFGVSPEGLVGRNTLELIHPDDLERAFAELHQITDLGDHATSEFRIVADDGTVFWVEETVTNLLDDPNVGYLVGNVRDITERKQHEQHQETDRRRMADAQRSAHLGSFELDVAAETVTCSDELKAILGLAPETPPSFDVFQERIHPDDLKFVETKLGEAVAGLPDLEYTHRIVRPDGAVRWVAARLTLSTDPASPGVSGTLLDITDRKQLELDLLHQATHDSLTGIANRSLLLEQLDATLRTSGVKADVGLLLFDVDRFKLINDSLGHDHGDQLLIAIADALRTTVARGEVLARFGSDAFAVMVPHLTSPAYALELAERIRARLTIGLVVGTDRHLPTISVGIVIAGAGDTAITTLRDAETAMYRAKEKGRDRAEWFDPSLHRAVVANFEVERDLRVAIANDELYLEFQPVLELDTALITSCEALVRWHHPLRGDLSPDEFIPVAENTGLVVDLGRWVLQRALVTAADWPETIDLAVNLSPRELAEPDLLAFVKHALGQLKFPASRLVFEITETAVLEDPTAAARAISALRALGVGVIIDDFGTGYTSLSFLRDFQLDGLKIDRSYVTGLDHGSTAIVDAIIRMSAALGLEVIAEGIETQAELTQLRALGCRFVQGYLVSRPVASADLPFMQPTPTVRVAD